MQVPTEHPLHFMPLTCADEGHEHLVEDEVFVRGRNSGYASALCGHQARIGPACAPVGHRCQHCESYRAARESLPSLARRLDGESNRHRKPSWIARILGGAA